MNIVVDNTNPCAGCKHYTPDRLFVLCKHPTSEYIYDGKKDHHTVSHMRSRTCPAGELREPA